MGQFGALMCPGGRGGRGLVEGSDIVVRQGGAAMDGWMESLINNNSIIKSELEKKQHNMRQHTNRNTTTDTMRHTTQERLDKDGKQVEP